MSLKEFQESLDLNSKFNNYFYKPIFRVAVGFILLLFVITLWTNNWQYQFIYAENTELKQIKNPFYVCEDTNTTTINFYYEDCIPKDMVPKALQKICNKGGCKKYLESGEIVGTKPNEFAKYFNLFVLIIVLLAFIYNHLMYLGGKKKNG